jgi:S-adenosyl methyltransferase
MHRPPHHHPTAPVKAVAHATARPRPTQPTCQARTWDERQRSPGRLPGDHHPRTVPTSRAVACEDTRAKGILLKIACISHLTADVAPDQVASGVAAYNALVPTDITARTHREVTALFGGLALIPPGVVPVSEWRPDHASVRGVSTDMYAGLATVRRSR